MLRGTPLVFAHRGASADAPENTMAAFRMAVEQGADGLELDIHMSRDGHLVVIHDDTLQRTTRLRGLVVQRTAAELARADASKRFPAYKGEPVPMLEEVLELARDAGLKINIELKSGKTPYPCMEEEAVKQVRRYGLEAQAIFSSFEHERLVKLKALAPDIETAVLFNRRMAEPSAYACSLGAGSLHPYYRLVTPEMVASAHQLGLAVRPYTVDGPRTARRLARMGVDAIITNVPAIMRGILTSPPSKR
ncbi:glycerophosphodiester phosphodiesterase [Xylanibacillus composti]|uniref:Glycerophosphoryl diester phosphodiesterase n=1 Tax=Xylanibacillus composti TaxID=1572762 RepID=A0A8J4M0D7_9BACL|nr:glycerophosphodiester phosphodiesterase [Xylanibacillus composti]GIQ67740.1 glycerophosphoryl diester phosphodiesterase [Xylanibacillus composti]